MGARPDTAIERAPAPPINLGSPAARARSAADVSAWNRQNLESARSVAQRLGLAERQVSPDGSRVALLIGLRPAGQPLYLATLNTNAAVSTATDKVRATPPFDLDGSGITIGLWDGGAPLSTHQELAGRVQVMDGAGPDNHATHVAGTLAAAGVQLRARGMAPAAQLHAYDFYDDTAEMIAAAANAPIPNDALLLSNHSYGHIAGWINFSGIWYWYGVWGEPEDRFFGQYNSYAHLYDEIVWNAPYYLPIVAAGNDRNDGPPSTGQTFYYWNNGWTPKTYNPATDPAGDGQVHGGYDTISSFANAKNLLLVGAVQGAYKDGKRMPTNAVSTVFSSWGPTDDGRIKPDVVAHGLGLYSSSSGGNASYTTLSGTSMAAPNVTGSAALLQELWMQMHTGNAMRASTLRGLVIHTANPIEGVGPNYRHGWGLMNTEAAANMLLAAQTADGAYLEELSLDASTPVRLWQVTRRPKHPLRATLAWTDPPGPATDALNSRTPRLVHDLDLRLADKQHDPLAPAVSLPYRLDWADPGAPATTGDNIRDNVEQVRASPPLNRPVLLRVSHKDFLTTGTQWFSLVLSGIQSIQPLSPLAVAIDQPEATVASGGHAPWRYSMVSPRDGFDAARSGNIGRNQQSWIETEVAGPARVSFWWRIESRPDRDYGRFRINGSEQTALSGTHGWQKVETELPTREPYLLRWSYEKPTQPGAQGADALWLDVLEIDPMLSILRLTGDLAFGSVTLGRSVTRTVTLHNAGDYPLTIDAFDLPDGFSGHWSGVIQPNDSVPANITFSPLVAGPYSGSLWIQSDADLGDDPLALSGFGTDLAVPAAWLDAYGLPTDGSVDFEDLDGDGFTVWQEWIADTDPTDPESRLHIQSMQWLPPDGLRVTWASTTSRWYTLARGTQAFDSAAFSPVTNLPGKAGSTSADDFPAGPGPYFYRVRVDLEP